ncbi:nucleotide-binding domain-containing protein [Choiromyces venosus 120613-1]|uniref:Nucleotide-binding domain-containing protein n=1 Tax=Choiromyces venosus 120613-1 TaxID=1336337 RepID=A0A3N4JV36_9PEZI|nr:nucleotide-binding domain-containing protein [Choiromyces venosus 120613-1]
MTTKKPEIVVLGAGVIGLQTALTLLEAGHSVTIIAKFWPGEEHVEYTSSKYHWRTHAGPDDLQGQRFDRETYEHWLELVKKDEDTGLVLIPSTYIWDSPTPETANSGASIWWSTLVPTFTPLTHPHPLLPEGAHFGISYQSFCLNPQTYLAYLLSRCTDHGVKTHTYEVDSLAGVFEYAPGAAGVVNCTGLGAIELVDPVEAEKLFPTRGQTILVSGEAEMARLRVGEGYISYVIRRPGAGTILGGCKVEGDWNEEVDEELSKEIMERCKILAPELLVNGEFEIISQQVGRRPSRRGGPRIEVEWKEMEGQQRFICHHYGHSGAG